LDGREMGAFLRGVLLNRLLCSELQSLRSSDFELKLRAGLILCSTEERNVIFFSTRICLQLAKLSSADKIMCDTLKLEEKKFFFFLVCCFCELFSKPLLVAQISYHCPNQQRPFCFSCESEKKT
jgi:hypothetical protein